jgi:hypothetical protein
MYKSIPFDKKKEPLEKTQWAITNRQFRDKREHLVHDTERDHTQHIKLK